MHHELLFAIEPSVATIPSRETRPMPLAFDRNKTEWIRSIDSSVIEAALVVLSKGI